MLSLAQWREHCVGNSLERDGVLPVLEREGGALVEPRAGRCGEREGEGDEDGVLHGECR